MLTMVAESVMVWRNTSSVMAAMVGGIAATRNQTQKYSMMVVAKLLQYLARSRWYLMRFTPFI